jgi:hypothetical protein
MVVQNISMALRSNPTFELIKALPEVGWRATKQYFQVRDSNDPKAEKWLSWVSSGPDFSLDQKCLVSLQKSMSQVQVLVNNITREHFSNVKLF